MLPPAAIAAVDVPPHWSNVCLFCIKSDTSDQELPLNNSVFEVCSGGEELSFPPNKRQAVVVPAAPALYLAVFTSAT